MLLLLKDSAAEAEIYRLSQKYASFSPETLSRRGRVLISLPLAPESAEYAEFLRNEAVERVIPARDALIFSGRELHPEGSVIEVAGRRFGGEFQFIAGPCSVESPAQLTEAALGAKEAGATVLRAGAFKPRSSPYSFQGLRAAGLKLLFETAERLALPVVTEIEDISQIRLYDRADILQVGARNMQNFALLKALGRQRKPVLLKRGSGATVKELLLSAEYIMSGGNERVILCERGIRTFENSTRCTLDISAVPVIKRLSHLPLIVDPSHASGDASLVAPLAMAAAAAGADGIMVEIHSSPEAALCDGRQAITPIQLKRLIKSVRALLPYAYKEYR